MKVIIARFMVLDNADVDFVRNRIEEASEYSDLPLLDFSTDDPSIEDVDLAMGVGLLGD